MALHFVFLYSVGDYTFVIELTKLAAKASIELWLSTGADPMVMRKILACECSQLVCITANSSEHTDKEIHTVMSCVKPYTPYQYPVIITSEEPYFKLIVMPPVVHSTIYNVERYTQ